ncbi:hypothetical protein [Pedobacter sp. WC2423]|uniref:hypothetical protein n=1 Tax=Pedobacter sp. WC2423 TaxID=3234142 RepID=UPI003467BC81
MGYSIYTEISKSIGLQGDPIDLPNKEEAERLHKAVTEDKCADAFKEVFKLYRFGKQAEIFAEQEISSLIYDAFYTGSKHFKTL